MCPTIPSLETKAGGRLLFLSSDKGLPLRALSSEQIFGFVMADWQLSTLLSARLGPDSSSGISGFGKYSL